jgi:hypothetical protein
MFTPAVHDALPLPGPALAAHLRLGRARLLPDDAAHVAAHAARTDAALQSGQMPGLRGASDAQAAPTHVGN